MEEDRREHIAPHTITHPLQLGIFERLIYQPVLSYGQLLPDGMAGHEFIYHLHKLVASGLVTKTDGQYQLSARGRLIADASSYSTLKLKVRPVGGVLLRVTQPDGRLLCATSHRAPLYGHQGLVYAKTRLGDSFADSLHWLSEMCQLNLDDAIVWSPLGVRYYDDAGALVCHRIGLLAEATCQPTDHLRTSRSAAYQWVLPSEVTSPELLWPATSYRDASVTIGA